MEVTQGAPFESFGLSEATMRAVRNKHYTISTPVQAGCIPPMLAGKDVIAKAPTGTGKTMAFGIPIIERIDRESEEVQAVILAPTRERAMQITDEMRDIAVCHEMAHQRGITAEEECNFIGILAAIRSDCAAYRYSGWLTGFGYLSNALYSADRDAWQIIRDSLPETVVADLRADNAYWSQFRGTVSQLSDKVYDGFLKSNGDTDGAKSYGVVTDLLVAYFGA